MGCRIATGLHPRDASRRVSHRATCDFPHPVRTADTATTGTRASSAVRFGPRSVKSAPAASAREARCITCSWLTSL